ncbi:MAG: hypothetical protein LBK73_07315 [Treponema sp.]|nr:hypothetical protein [Treponema sp.]
MYSRIKWTDAEGVSPAQDGVKRECTDYKTFLKAYETCLLKQKTNGSTIIEAGGS